MLNNKLDTYGENLKFRSCSDICCAWFDSSSYSKTYGMLTERSLHYWRQTGHKKNRKFLFQRRGMYCWWHWNAIITGRFVLDSTFQMAVRHCEDHLPEGEELICTHHHSTHTQSIAVIHWSKYFSLYKHQKSSMHTKCYIISTCVVTKQNAGVKQYREIKLYLLVKNLL